MTQLKVRDWIYFWNVIKDKNFVQPSNAFHIVSKERQTFITEQTVGRGNFPLHWFWVLADRLKIKFMQDKLTEEKKKKSLISVHKGIIKMRPTQWPKQEVFILLDKEIINV